jgi:hypothetical protein
MAATNTWHFGHGELVMGRFLPITDSPLPPDQVKASVCEAGDDRVGYATGCDAYRLLKVK